MSKYRHAPRPIRGGKHHTYMLVGLLTVVLCAMAFMVTGCGNEGETSSSASSETSSATSSETSSATSSETSNSASSSEKAVAKKQVKVPDLQYYDKEDVEKALKEVGLKLGKATEEYTTDIPEGFTIKQKPEAGKQVDEGSKVDIVLAKGFTRTTVPDVTGMTPDEAEEAFFKAWIVPVPGEPVHSEATDPGLVCAQSVQGGQEVDVLKHVVYATSLGAEMVTVPDVTPMTVTEARAALKNAGLGVDTNSSYSDDKAKDGIISQSIDAGDQVAKGTVVHLEVSLGAKPNDKVRIPNVLTYTLEDAKKALESAGFGYSYDEGNEEGTVVSTSPQVGTEVDQGTVVNLTLQRPTDVTIVVVEEGSKSTDGPTMTEQEARNVIWEQGLGDDQSARKVQGDDGVWDWEIVANDTQGSPHTYIIDPDGNVTEV